MLGQRRVQKLALELARQRKRSQKANNLLGNLRINKYTNQGITPLNSHTFFFSAAQSKNAHFLLYCIFVVYALMVVTTITA